MDVRTKLAKNVTEEFVRRRKELVLPVNLSEELKQQRACYVYLYQKPGQRLKAMHGYPLPCRANLGEEIIANTISAISGLATGVSIDPAVSSFLLIKKADLGSIMYSVAVLEPLQRVGDVSHLQPRLYGLYLRSDSGKWAVVMSQRSGIVTGQDQLATALREAAINHRRESYVMYRFGVKYYE